MKRFIVMLFLVGVIMPTFASVTLPTNVSLTDAQKAQLVIEAEKMSAKPISPTQVQEWVDVGNAIGEGLAGAAGKLGVEVNNFASTPVGIFTMILIAWEYIGSDIALLMISFTFTVFGGGIWLYLYRRTFIIDKVTYNHKNEGPRKVVHYKSSHETSSDEKVMYAIFAVLLMIVIVVPLANI